jgi:hypothetical protein
MSEDLVVILSRLYETSAKVRALAGGLVPIELVDTQGNAVVVCSSLVREAHKCERLAAIVERACQQYPEHREALLFSLTTHEAAVRVTERPATSSRGGSSALTPPSREAFHFVQTLLRARDWQSRSELSLLCDWWRRGETGIAALVGIGGAGKTAIVERMLRMLPGVLADDSQIQKDMTLPIPEGLFVFSFYDSPNPDSFFGRLAAWVNGEIYDDSAPPPSYEQTRERLRHVGRRLLVLDGLERAQDDGVRGGIFGQILDGRVRDLVARLALGFLPEISAIITTRFPIASLEEEQPPHYLVIPVGEIGIDAGIALLRQRGVHGTDKEMARVVSECGSHALTVDLAGGYLAEFADGDPNSALALGSDSELQRAVEREPNPHRRAVRKQEIRFTRITERYRETLAKRDPSALAVLERVCLFRIGVSAKMLARTFLGRKNVKVAGPALTQLDEKQLQERLDLLAEMRLLEAVPEPAEARGGSARRASLLYNVHPAVRAGFLCGLDAVAARIIHNTIRGVFFKRLPIPLQEETRELRAGQALDMALGGTRTFGPQYPVDDPTLDQLEEIIYHQIQMGDREDAFESYMARMGGFIHLAVRLGALERGNRVCQAFVEGQSPLSVPLAVGLSDKSQLGLLNEWVIYLQGLGQVEAAVRCQRFVAREIRRHQNWDDINAAECNLAFILELCGRLREMEEAASRAVRIRNTEVESNIPRATQAHARALRGKSKSAFAFFQNLTRDDGLHPNLYRAELLTRLGQFAEAWQLAEKILEDAKAGDAVPRYHLVEVNLLLAELAWQRGDELRASQIAAEAHSWALMCNAQPLLCASAVVRARITLDSNPAICREIVEDGLRIALDCGFGIYHIDLRNVRAKLSLNEGRHADAIRDATVALSEGVHPSPEFGLPTLLAAADPECGYLWGEAEARHVLAQALLLTAIQTIGDRFDPAKLDALPVDACDLISRARFELTNCLQIRKRIGDSKQYETERILHGLQHGQL